MRVLLLVGIIASTILVAWLSDQRSHYFWSERQVIFVLAPLYLLAAIGVRHLLGLAGQIAGSAAHRGWLGLPEVGWRDHRTAISAGLGAVVMAGWLALYWSPVNLVYQDRWLPKEDWRGVTAYIDKESCAGTQYWTYINAHASYGFAYYDPSLLSRGHFLWLLPDGSIDTSPIEAVRRQNLGVHDWIVLGAGNVADSTSGGTVDSVLRNLGWSPTSFLGLVVYHQETCGA